MTNIKAYLRREAKPSNDTKNCSTQPRRKCLTHEERCKIYDEYKQSKASVKQVCENNNISVSCLYLRVIPYMERFINYHY